MTFKQRYFATLLAAILLSAINAHALTGSWRGDLILGQAKLPLVFNFSETPEGQILCTMDSPQQGAKGIPTEIILCTTDSVSFTCKAIGASYTGKITIAEIRGTFRQNGYSFPLNLTPESPIEERHPQTPQPPYPYQIVDTVFIATDGAVMSATFTLPANVRNEKIPAVVMVTGSGPQNRDEEIFEHKPFAVIADHLARHGIASLRYDDRGTGRSTGNFLTATTETFRDDAQSGIAFLRGIDLIGKVGVLGHSEGGTIAFMIGAENQADFIISLAGMAVSGKETLLRQNNRGLDALQISDTERENSRNMIKLFLDAMAGQAQNGISLPIDADSLAAANGLHVPDVIMESLKMSQQVRTPWFDKFLILNPQKFLHKVKCPTLAINGDKDVQVDPDNLTVVQNLVPHATTMLMPGLNHLLQHAATGETTEYAEIRETISPDVLDTIVQFINSLNNN